MKDPFGTLDSLDLSWKGFQFNVLRDDQKLCNRFVLPILVLIPLLCWVLLGSDSTADQVAFFVWNLPQFLLGKITFPEWIAVYSNRYGLGTHWSASVIYGLLLVGISKYLREKRGIKNSENLCITCGFVGLAISTFEFFWIGSYYVFQNQPWIVSLVYPQVRILMQNFLFLLVGIIVLVGINLGENGRFNKGDYALNLDKKTLFFLSITIGLVLLWWFYPFPVQQISVPVQGLGIWNSTLNFPQTMYTVDVNILDNQDIGEMFHVDNPAIHLLNNLCKIFWTLTFYSLGKIRKRVNVYA